MKFSFSLSPATKAIAVLASAACIATAQPASAQQRVKVSITSNAPDEGIVLTPVWVGFHSGNFDSYDGGLTAQPGLERIAEDGSTALLSQQFLDVNANGGYTYVQTPDTVPSSAMRQDALVRTGDASDSARQDATIGSTEGPGPLQPGETVSQEFTLSTDGSNQYISYVSMVLPSNDFFVANGNPLAHSLAPIFNGSTDEISFDIGLPGTVNDAGTEVEDFDNVAPPLGGLQAFFPNAGFSGTDGQDGPDVGDVEGIAIANVAGDPFADFLNNNGLDLSALNFNDANLYPNGIATVTITAIPEPSTVVIGLLGAVGVGIVARRRR